MPYFRAFQLFWLRLPYLWIQSLLWWISIVSYFDIQVNPCWNRTLTYHFSTSISLNHDWTLGGPRYIHLTKGTNAVFSGFSAFSVTATNFMNSITFVMNHLISYFDISICHCSNRTLCYHLFKFHGFNYGYFLGGPRYIHLTKETSTKIRTFLLYQNMLWMQ